MNYAAALGTWFFTASALIACGGSSEDSSNNNTGGTAGIGAMAGAGGAASGGTAGAPGGAAGSATGGTGNVSSGPKASECFKDIYDGAISVDYDQFNPTIGSHCQGTNHQDIQGVERLVFLGDSITDGSFPTPQSGFYRTLLGADLTAKFPGLQVDSCAKGGADIGDIAGQITQCFPGGGDNKKTLIVFTIGGNDIVPMATSKLNEVDGVKKAGELVAALDAQVKKLKDPNNFPNGSYVAFANVYEYTDATTEMSSCPLAITVGLSGKWPAGLAVFKALREGYMKIAVDTKSDMIFMGEEFCGHGYKAGDANGQCYRGPGAKNWFDASCIHPNPTGHGEIAKIFSTVIAE